MKISLFRGKTLFLLKVPCLKGSKIFLIVTGESYSTIDPDEFLSSLEWILSGIFLFCFISSELWKISSIWFEVNKLVP